MINADMRYYYCFTFGKENEYGTPVIDESPKKMIKMAIYPTSTSVQDNVLYKSAEYIGITHETGIDDKCLIQYGDKRLKVLYIIDKGRYNQIFMESVH